MYTDYALFGLGTLSVVATVLLIIYMIRSKKKSSFYKKVLAEDTSTFDPYTATASLSKSNPIHGTITLGTETETLDHSTSTLSQGNVNLDDINIGILDGKYEIIEELFGGGMSRIFRARNVKLGNEWAIKHVSHRNAGLANEESILKQLNHINLPQIIDIFQDESGIFLVERYIEGFTLNKVLAIGQKLGQSLIIDWAEQMTQVLSYLHNLENPIIHCDLKPSNIMVTHDNKLVLIDFGISKQQGIDDEKARGVTYSYAAPEQIKHIINEQYRSIVEARFGELPEERLNWKTDTRTDIYSLGVILFEMAVGSIPTISNYDQLKDKVSIELAGIIYKCLELNPEQRYQSAKELLSDIQKIKNTKVSMARVLFLRKLAAVMIVVNLLMSGCSYAAGAYLYQQENLSILGLDPDSVLISEQQTAELIIQKIKPDGKVEYIDPTRIDWSYSGGEIARIDGNRIVGINEGAVEVYGRYRNKLIDLNVSVVKPMNSMVDISLRYIIGTETSIFAGKGEREFRDGEYLKASFVSPESIDIMGDGSIIVTDAGKLRKLKDGRTETIDFEPDYITANIVRCYDNDIYVLTHEWEDEDGKFYGIIKLTDQGAEGLFISDSVYTKISDFDIDSDGTLFYIENNVGVGQTYLQKLDTSTGIREVVAELDEGSSALTFDQNGNIYIAKSKTGSIACFDTATSRMRYFASIEGERHFIDGNIAKFYEPRKLKLVGDKLYVLDFNVLRRVTIRDGIPLFTETIAGKVTTENNPETKDGKGSDLVLAPSTLMDFAVKDGSIIITDPKKGVVREVTVPGTTRIMSN